MNTLQDNLEKTADRCGLPDNATRSAFINYAVRGIPPGSFTRSILENKPVLLVVLVADLSNSLLINTWVKWLYNEFPGNIWGSEAAVENHIKSFQNESS